MKGSLMEVYAATRRNDAFAIRDEISAGAPVNTVEKGREKVTLLHWAAEEASVKLSTLKALVEAGANPKLGALETVGCAAHTGDLERVRYFEGLGCPVVGVDRHGYTVLHSAVLGPNEPADDLVEYLLEAGVDVLARSKYQETAAGYALRRHKFDQAKRLAYAGAFDEADFWSPAIRAVVLQDSSLVEANREHVNHESFSFGQWSAIQVAMRMGSIELVERLAALGANLRFKDRSGSTLFSDALQSGSPEIIEWCFEHVCRSHLRKSHAKNAHVFAAASGSLPVAQWLFDHDIPIVTDGWTQESPLYDCRTPEMADFYAAKGEDVNNLEFAQSPVLTHLVEDGNIDMLRYWILKGADVNVGYTRKPLHKAVWADSDEAVDLLVAAGADIDPLDVDGDTPMCYARSVAMVKKLMDAGADPDHDHWVYGSVRKHLLETDDAFGRILG